MSITIVIFPIPNPTFFLGFNEDKKNERKEDKREWGDKETCGSVETSS